MDLSAQWNAQENQHNTLDNITSTAAYRISDDDDKLFDGVMTMGIIAEHTGKLVLGVWCEFTPPVRNRIVGDGTKTSIRERVEGAGKH